MRKLVAIAGISLVAATLGGCQSITGSSLAASNGPVDMAEYFEARLEAGRSHLTAGRISKAINAFKQASYDPRYAGEAYNGMAVAFDRIGRADLASRYFAKAMEADPTDERFARNLARLEGRPAQPLPTLTEEVPAQFAASEIAIPDVRGPITIQPRAEEPRGRVKVERPPTARIARSSQGQVSVDTSNASNVVRMVERIEEPARITVETRGAAQRVVERVRRNAQARRGYPIRIVLRDESAKRP